MGLFTDIFGLKVTRMGENLPFEILFVFLTTIFHQRVDQILPSPHYMRHYMRGPMSGPKVNKFCPVLNSVL